MIDHIDGALTYITTLAFNNLKLHLANIKRTPKRIGFGSFFGPTISELIVDTSLTIFSILSYKIPQRKDLLYGPVLFITFKKRADDGRLADGDAEVLATGLLADLSDKVGPAYRPVRALPLPRVQGPQLYQLFTLIPDPEYLHRAKAARGLGLDLLALSTERLPGEEPEPANPTELHAALRTADEKVHGDDIDAVL